MDCMDHYLLAEMTSTMMYNHNESVNYIHCSDEEGFLLPLSDGGFLPLSPSDITPPVMTSFATQKIQFKATHFATVRITADISTYEIVTIVTTDTAMSTTLVLFWPTTISIFLIITIIVTTMNHRNISLLTFVDPWLWSSRRTYTDSHTFFTSTQNENIWVLLF